MNVNEKIRMLRELNHWSQEEMAERLEMSHNGYAKIERGETKLYLEKLNQIAQVSNIDLSELVANHDKSIFFFLHGTCNQAVNYYGSGNHDEIAEIEKLKLEDETVQDAKVEFNFKENDTIEEMEDKKDE